MYIGASLGTWVSRQLLWTNGQCPCQGVDCADSAGAQRHHFSDPISRPVYIQLSIQIFKPYVPSHFQRTIQIYLMETELGNRKGIDGLGWGHGFVIK